MAVQSFLPTTHLLHSNNNLLSPIKKSCFAANKSLVFGDFVGLCCKSKRTRRKISSSSRRCAVKNWTTVKSVLNVEGSKRKSDSKVANLEDILSERGACGVGFIANLDNKASHQIIKDALTALGCMEHRGGCGADNDSGDGSGVMSLIPWDLFDNWTNKQGLASLDKKHTGVGMVFLPKDDESRKEAKKEFLMDLSALYSSSLTCWDIALSFINYIVIFLLPLLQCYTKSNVGEQSNRKKLQFLPLSPCS